MQKRIQTKRLRLPKIFWHASDMSMDLKKNIARLEFFRVRCSGVPSTNTQNKGSRSGGAEDACMEKMAVFLVNCARARNLTSSLDSYVTMYTHRVPIHSSLWPLTGGNEKQGHLMDGRHEHKDSGHAAMRATQPPSTRHHTAACTAGWSMTACGCRARKQRGPKVRSKR